MTTIHYPHPTDGTEVMLVVHHARRGVVSTSYHASRDEAEAEGHEACEGNAALSWEIRDA